MKIRTETIRFPALNRKIIIMYYVLRYENPQINLLILIDLAKSKRRI